MMQKQFAEKVISTLKNDNQVLGLAAAGSWIHNEMDEYSDLDLVLVSVDKIAGDTDKMIAYAESFGHLLSAFTGEHVGEKRLLICLYSNPLLHVDIKFVTAEQFSVMIEKPVILFDRKGLLRKIVQSARPTWPFAGFQWIEDRFWVWIHYLIQKLARGEYFEVLDGLGFLRSQVLSPLIRIGNGQQPRGVRKVEMELSAKDLDVLKLTLSSYEPSALFTAVNEAVVLYRQLRNDVYDDSVTYRSEAENMVMEYISGTTPMFIHEGGR